MARFLYANRVLLTHSADREVKILDVPVLTKDLVEMVLVDVFGQALDDDLRDVSCCVIRPAPTNNDQPLYMPPVAQGYGPCCHARDHGCGCGCAKHSGNDHCDEGAE